MATIEQFREWFEQDYKNSEGWRLEAKRDFGFTEGYAQWPEDKKAEVQRMQNRPALTLNNILPTINVISGQERAARVAVMLKPRGIEDDTIAAIMNATYRFAEEQSEMPFEISASFQDMAICGRGYVELGVTMEDPLEPFGEVSCRRRHPLSIFHDASADEYSLQDGERIARASWQHEDTLRLYFPKQMADVKAGEWLQQDAQFLGDAQYWNQWIDRERKRIRVLQMWYKVPRRAHFLIHPDQMVDRFATEEAAVSARDAVAQAYAAARAQVPDMPIFARVVRDVRVADMCFWKILADRPSPYRHGLFPFVPLTAFHLDELVMGVVRNMRDPQMEGNKRWSQILHIINTMAKGNVGVPKGSVDDFEKFRENYGKGGYIYEFNKDIGRPEADTVSGQLPTALVELAMLLEDQMRKISLVNQELLGLSRAPDQSGKAMNVMKQAGITGLAPIFDSGVRSQKLIGRQTISLIQQYYPAEKVAEVVGPVVMAKLRQEQMASQLLTGVPIDPMSRFQQALAARYDVAVDVSALMGTERERNLQTLAELFKAAPLPIILKSIFEVSDFPNKQATLAAIDQMPTQAQGQPAGAGQPTGA